MSYELVYTVVNSDIVTLNVPIEIDGQKATAAFNRVVVEATSKDVSGKTLTLSLPMEAEGKFPEGSDIKVTVEAVVAADAPKDEEA